VKVYLDENLSPEIAKILRRSGVDAVSAHEVGNIHVDDRAQLAYATGDGRVLVTANVVDFLALAREAVQTNSEHAGMILVPSSFRSDEFRAIADAIREAVRRHPEGLRGLVVYVERKSRRQSR
jgi:uncharacterized protein with PIN domain